jgi:hypothetical protein
MSQTFVSVQPRPDGKVLIEAQNKKEVISVICNNDHVIMRLMLMQFKLWLWNIRNSVIDAVAPRGSLSRAKEEK